MRTELTIRCKRHHDIALITYVTNDGYVIGVKPGHWTHEFIGHWVPTDDELRDLGLSRAGVAVASPRPGQEQHFRYHLRCPKPSCGYHLEIETRVTEWVHLYMRGLYRAGQTTQEITDMDAWIRKMTRANPDASVLWVMMRYPGVEGLQRVPNNPAAIAGQQERGWVLVDATQ